MKKALTLLTLLTLAISLFAQEADHDAWLKSEVAKSKRQALPDFDSPDFFRRDTARLVGYIKGYDTESQEAGLIYAYNCLTRENNPVVITIHPDGRFEANVMMQYPTVQNTTCADRILNVYLEPGCTLGIVIDPDANPESRYYQNSELTFYGPVAEMNTALFSVGYEEYNWEEYENALKTYTPAQFAPIADALLEKNMAKLAAKKDQLSPKAYDFLSNDPVVAHAYLLLDFINSRFYQREQNPDNEALKADVPDNYYDFLTRLPLDKQVFFTSMDIGSFINRFEYNTKFSDLFHLIHSADARPEKTFFQFLIEDEGIEFKGGETWVEMQQKLIDGKLELTEEERKVFMKQGEEIREFSKANSALINKYKSIYMSNIENKTLKAWRLKDSAMIDDLKLQPNFISQTIKLRELDRLFKEINKDEATEILTMLNATYLKHPFLRSEAQRIFAQGYPEGDGMIFELGDTPAADLFREMIAPFKGKYIYVDFWDTYCAPCIAGIMDMKDAREQYKDSEDIVFVYITSTSGSPTSRYDKIVKEQGLEHSYRLSDIDFFRMRELFGFNGIPHYRAVNREGVVMKPNISAWALLGDEKNKK